MRITESKIMESIDGNMDDFRKKALKGDVSGEDVANLFGHKEMFSEGERQNELLESSIRESVEKNMDSFRSKALRGKIDGGDVANLFGFGKMFSEGEELEREFESLRDEVVSEMVSEADEEEETEDSDNPQEESGDGETAPDNGDGDDSDNENSDDGEESREGDSGDEENAEDEDKEPEDDKEKEEKEKGPLKDGETTHLESFEELFNETGTKLKIQKQGIGPEPSPMFGQSSAKHNKYKISLVNDKGGDVSWIYWDSEKNTKDGTVPDSETIMKDFGLKLEAAVVGISFENFKEQFGYDDMDNTLAQKQYDGLRRMKEDIKKIYPDQHNVYQLIQIAKKS